LLRMTCVSACRLVDPCLSKRQGRDFLSLCPVTLPSPVCCPQHTGSLDEPRSQAELLQSEANLPTSWQAARRWGEMGGEVVVQWAELWVQTGLGGSFAHKTAVSRILGSH
jgi:hypothetical protein